MRIVCARAVFDAMNLSDELKERAERVALAWIMEGQKVDDNTRIHFGKHAGKKLIDVPAGYLLWLSDQPRFKVKNPELSAYIEDNRKALELEQKESEN